MPDNVVSVVITGSNEASPALDAAMLEIDALNAKVQAMGSQMAVAGERMTFSMQEARGTAALLGEEVGVHIPRHLATFMAGLPGVGVAMSAAFSGVAIIGIIELLVKATEKLADFIDETFIYTQAMRDSEAATAAVNLAIGDQSVQLQKLLEAYNLIGLSGPDKIKAQFMELADSVRDAERALSDARETVWLAARDMVDLTPQQLTQVKQNVDVLTAFVATNQQRMANLSKEYDDEMARRRQEAGRQALADQQALGVAAINAQKSTQNAQLDLAIAYLQMDAANHQKGAEEVQRLTDLANEQKYKNELDALQSELALLDQNPNTSPTKITEIYTKIETLQVEHLAKMVSEEAKATAQIEQLEQAAAAAQINMVLGIGGAAMPQGPLDPQKIKITNDSMQLFDNTVRGLDRDVGNLFNSFSNTGGALAAFENFGKSIIATIDQMVAKMLVEYAIMKLLGMGISGGGNWVDLGSENTWMGQVGITGHAGGGSMAAGEIGMIGERGPELWLPDTAGTVIPNSQLGSALGGGDTYYMDFRGAQRGVSQEVKMAIAASEARSSAKAQLSIYEHQRRRP